MSSQDRRSTGNRGPKYGQYGQEDALATEEISVERKSFTLSLKENSRGLFLRITEDVGGRRDHIIVPAEGLRDFKEALDRIVDSLDENESD